MEISETYNICNLTLHLQWLVIKKNLYIVTFDNLLAESYIINRLTIYYYTFSTTLFFF